MEATRLVDAELVNSGLLEALREPRLTVEIPPGVECRAWGFTPSDQFAENAGKALQAKRELESRVCFDVPCAEQFVTEFKGLEPVAESEGPVPPPRKGLTRVKAMLPLFEGNLAVFHGWRARLTTCRGVYDFIGPKTVDRDLRDDSARITLHFGQVDAIQAGMVTGLTIYDRSGVPIIVGTQHTGFNPGDTIHVNYSLNV